MSKKPCHISKIVICIDEELKYHNKKKLVNHLDELDTYIENNCHLIPNYGERWRYGERISTGFVESTINEVVAKRMVKKQQMQMDSKRRSLYATS